MVQSLSSKAISAVTAWRNPTGREEEWLVCFSEKSRKRSVVRVVIAEVVFLLTPIIAVIETIAAGILAFFCLALDFISIHKPLAFAVKWLDSAYFAITWSTANIFLNISDHNLFTYEALARLSLIHGIFFRLPNLI